MQIARKFKQNSLEKKLSMIYNKYRYLRKDRYEMENRIENLGFKRIDPDNLSKLEFNPFKMIGKDWMLVSAGDESGWNTMTASWGFMGVMWGKNVVTTVIRPQRYTKEFIDNSEYFTLCFFDEDQRAALAYCGKYSGRDVDKAKETGLTPVFTDGTTAFEQAKTIIVCRKMYSQDMNPECFIDKSADEQWYPNKDYHTAYIAEITAVYVK